MCINTVHTNPLIIQFSILLILMYRVPGYSDINMDTVLLYCMLYPVVVSYS